MKRDGYGFAEKWDAWKRDHFKSIKGIRKEDHALLIAYLKDMELGVNVSVDVKGARGAGTLLNLAQHNLFFMKHFRKPLLKLKKEDIALLEKEINEGKIVKSTGEKFRAFGNYIKDLKAFWNWMIRTGRVKENILVYSSSRTDKPAWVYLTEEQIKTFFNNLRDPYYRAIAWFMYDSGARVTEANSIQIKHFSKDFKQVTIPEEAAKTFERTINLKLCSDLVRDYVNENKLQAEDFLFKKDLWTINKYLKDHCGKRFGKDNVSHPKAKGKYGNFTLYDIRHNSACFWLNRYPTHKDLMYRMGWKQSDKVDYYTGFLGQADKLSDADMIAVTDKPKIYLMEQQLNETNRKLAKLTEVLSLVMSSKISQIEVDSKDKSKVASLIAELGLINSE